LGLAEIGGSDTAEPPPSTGGHDAGDAGDVVRMLGLDYSVRVANGEKTTLGNS
jgi:hypothetical protein